MEATGRSPFPFPLPLIGFLSTTLDTLRRYLSLPGTPGPLAADVRLSGPLTAIEASLPTLLMEKERWRKNKTDPHCWRLVDLTAGRRGAWREVISSSVVDHARHILCGARAMP
ncbi:hypothetical protein OG889_27985 [Streptomyces sp. NBC_00481]|uniref:hypothetical protein n=1 Tax=unclassified Streptomyces TaxID=2593676 RepID=UPI002DD7EAA1|nr:MULTISPECIES: hypothetical protein [unclassified Streptomyces]WRY98201.1 hypothetical protein OG889_27985 [Streptomyces sp. NBC_00481]